MNHKQERDILELQAQLVRLKITSAYLQQRQNKLRSTTADKGLNNVLGLTNTAFNIFEGLSARRWIWSSFLLPFRWKKRFGLILALLALKYWYDTKHR